MSTGRPPAPEVASMTTSWPSIGFRGPHDRHRHARGGLVVRPGQDVAGGVGLRLRRGARLGLDDDRVGEEGRARGGLGELGGELAVGQVQRALADQAECRGVPERGGAAVAEDDLVARGQREELREARPDPGDQRLHRLLPVRGAHQGAGCGQRGELLGAHLGGSAAEAPVDGLEVGGDREVDGRGSCHAFQCPCCRLGFTGQGRGVGRNLHAPRAGLPGCSRSVQHGGVCDDGYAGPARRARAPRG